MKTYATIAVFALLTLLSSCQPEVFDCEAYRWGTLNISNSSGYDLEVYLDDQPLAIVPAGTRTGFTNVAAGYHSVYAEQISTQQSWQNNITMQTCQTVNLVFTP